MADRFAATIRIGGTVSRTKRLYPDDPEDDTTILQGLISALSQDGASHEFGEPGIEENCTEKVLLHDYQDGGVLLFKDDQAVNGEFEQTEQFCMDCDIPFDRWSDHYCEYDAENAHWRPGQDGIIVAYADSSGKEIIDGETVREALAKITEFEANVHEHNQKPEWKDLFIGIRLLNDACPEKPDNLLPFEISA